MFSWWSSLDAVTRFNVWVQWALAIFGGLTFIALILVAATTKQIGVLQGRESQQLREQLREANQKTEEERQARIRIEQRIASRSLTAEQRASLPAALQQGPKAKVTVSSVGDGEAVAFANELVAILRQAGWPTNPIVGQMLGYNPEGLLIAVGDPNNPPSPAIAFQRALAAIGFNALWTKEGGLPPDSFNLLVGHKPQQ